MKQMHFGALRDWCVDWYKLLHLAVLCFSLWHHSSKSFNHHLSKIFKRGNFRCTQQSVGVENQLQHLASIIQVLDPKLHGHLGMEQRLVGLLDIEFCVNILLVLHPAIGSCRLLNTETLGGGDYLFAFRMFMVLFRRELSFGDSLYLWEVKVTSWHVTLNLEHSMHLPIWGVIFELGPLAFILVLRCCGLIHWAALYYEEEEGFGCL